MRTLVMLLCVRLMIWAGCLAYFWVLILALCVSPFLFNPHPFSAANFVIDYGYVVFLYTCIQFAHFAPQGVPSLDEPW